MSKFIVVLSFLLALSVTSSAETKNVLWLGNSYTYFHDLPKMVQQLAKGAGQTINYVQNTNGGWTLQKHASDKTTTDLIISGKWDVVILQEISQLPVFGEKQVCAQSVAAQKKLDALIRKYNPNAVIQFYETWGRPGEAEFEQWQYWLTLRYKTFACMASKPSRSAPVGEAFKRYGELFGLEARTGLYEDNDHHASEQGAYLAACVHYLAIFGSDIGHIMASGYFGPLDADTAYNLQAAAQQAWNSGEGWDYPDNDSCDLKMLQNVEHEGVKYGLTCPK